MKQQLRPISLGFLGLFFLYLYSFAYALGCLNLVMSLILVGVIFYNLQEIALKQKICKARCYFKNDTWIYTLLTKRFFVYLSSLFIATLMGLSLALNLMLFDLSTWTVFGLDLFVLWGLYRFLSARLSGVLKPELIDSVVKKWSVSINAVVLIFALVMLQLFSQAPDFIAPTLTQTVDNASALVASQCAFINYLAKLNAELNALFWWFMLGSLDLLQDQMLSLVVWIFFFITNVLSVWGFGIFIIELMGWTRKKALVNEV